MKVMVIGGGGREHTLAWKISQSPLVDVIYCVPGNAGMAQIAKCLDLPLAEDGFERVAAFAEKEGIDLTVVGPEAPLVSGIVDLFSERGLAIFGPTKAAAQIEDSKSFSKAFMLRYGIPTAQGISFDDPDEAARYIRDKGAPIVVKADGSAAAGKGSFVCEQVDKALEAVRLIMIDRIFGDAGDRVVVEEYLEGEEASFIVLTDGETILPLVTSQDHKRAYDGDRGPNTGGMGAYSPAPVIDPKMRDEIIDDIILPVIEGMKREGRPYRGALYAGLMITDGGPKVLEFNCRFGDPETQVILPRLDSDLVPALIACIEGRLKEIELRWREDAAVCVVLASGGYPGKYEKGKPITGIEEAESIGDVVIFHAGTAMRENRLVTNGGRVLGVTAIDRDIPSAIERAYKAVSKIHFEKMHYRRDIGQKALKRLGS
ncbi:phosphoribosylamine--glycine ligase [Candidatus Poribacteria bacterium]|nr:phosphoribosylamine--glycine ligase [Candidatus Poribacteria bacterium]